MEIAFISAGKLNVEIRKSRGSRRGKLIADFFENPNDFLSTMLVGNNIALVIFTATLEILMKPYLSPLIEKAPTWMPQIFVEIMPITIIVTLVVLFFGEFLPKIFFRLFADKVLFFFAYPIAATKFILTPLSWMMVNLSGKLLRLFLRVPPEDTQGVFTRLDLEKFVESTSSGNEEEEQLIDTDMFNNVLYLKQTRVRECMIPRTEMEVVEVTDTIEDLRKIFIDSSHSKIIVYKESIDDIIGYVHHQKLLENPKRIYDAMRKIIYVPETMKVQNLMNVFIRERSSIACVVDEFGGTAGIITLEDILEEIFGEIADEHDAVDEMEIQVSDYEYKFSGRLEIDYINEKYEHINLPEGEYHTISGYIVMTMGNIPKQDDIITLDGYDFILEMVSETKIETV
ncbi:MAG: hemolysin family protein, partial [Saprospiraceae bacterium]